MLKYLIAVLILTVSLPALAEDASALCGQKGVYSVAAFGAKGDGTTDDTAAVQSALDAAGKVGGGIVFLPTGRYLIKGHLVVPVTVTLEGVWRTPTAGTQNAGSVLLAVQGKGSEQGEPFILLQMNSVLKGVTVFYPEQDRKNPVPYPWCVKGKGDNASIVDVLLVNPWNAVDFGTDATGRHMIRNLYGQPLHTGIFIDKCFDVGRVENVHFWPFWDINLMDYTTKNATAFVLARSDWEFVTGCFCIAYKVGFHFKALNDGGGNYLFTNSGSDVGPTALLVDTVQAHSGIVWTNCQFMAGIEVKETNQGPVKFNNCGFWGVKGVTTTHADLKGKATVTFNECHFNNWDTKKEGVPAIVADCRSLTISSCDFVDRDKKQIAIGENVKGAVIMGNHLRSGAKIENKSQGKVEIGLNADE